MVITNRNKTKILNKFIYWLTSIISITLFAQIANCQSTEIYIKEIEQLGLEFSNETFFDEIKAGNREIIELFIKAGVDVNSVLFKDDVKLTPLIWASHIGNLKIVNILEENGADINVMTNAGTAVMQASLQGHFKIVKFLIEKGAQINVKDEIGFTALIHATNKGSLNIVKLLIEEGADANAKTILGVTALMYASDKGSIEIAKLLIANGADINAIDKARRFTALMWALDKGNVEVAELLRKAGAEEFRK